VLDNFLRQEPHCSHMILIIARRIHNGFFLECYQQVMTGIFILLGCGATLLEKFFNENCNERYTPWFARMNKPIPLCSQGTSKTLIIISSCSTLISLRFLKTFTTSEMANDRSPSKFGKSLHHSGGHWLGYPGISLTTKSLYTSWNSYKAILHHVLISTWELNNKWNLCTLSPWSLQGEL